MLLSEGEDGSVRCFFCCVSIEAGDGIEIRLASCDDAGVGAMFVYFDLQKRFIAQFAGEKFEKEGIGSAAEVCDVEGVNAGAFADESRCLHDAQSIAPIHIAPSRVFGDGIEREHVHGNWEHVHAEEFFGEVKVGAGVASVIGSSNDNNDFLFRRDVFENIRSPRLQGIREYFLRLIGGINGAADF